MDILVCIRPSYTQEVHFKHKSRSRNDFICENNRKAIVPTLVTDKVEKDKF